MSILNLLSQAKDSYLLFKYNTYEVNIRAFERAFEEIGTFEAGIETF